MGLVEIERVNSVSIVRFARPEKLNALNLEMWVSLREALSRECSGEIRGIVLTGSGRAFSAGDDIGAMYALNSVEEAIGFFETLRATLETLALCPKPIVAAVNGLAVGGGAEMLLLVDYVIASRGSWIAFPESRIGLIPPLLLTIGVDTLGLRLARRLALTGERIDVEDAARLGLVDEVVDGDKLVSIAVERALKLAEYTTPEALRAIKRILYARYSSYISEAVRILAELSLTPEAKERMKAFLEKRFKAY